MNVNFRNFSLHEGLWGDRISNLKSAPHPNPGENEIHFNVA